MRHRVRHLRHFAHFIAELLAGVHRQGAGADAVTDSLRTVLAAVTLFAV